MKATLYTRGWDRKPMRLGSLTLQGVTLRREGLGAHLLDQVFTDERGEVRSDEPERWLRAWQRHEQDRSGETWLEIE